MNDEIKEILDYYRKDIEKKELFMKDYTEKQLKTTFQKSYQRYKNHKLLLDYITNLQEENKRLQQNNYDMQKEMAMCWQKIDKAVEYIKNNALYYEDYDYDINEELYLTDIVDSEAKQNLLNILQNGSDEE